MMIPNTLENRELLAEKVVDTMDMDELTGVMVEILSQSYNDDDGLFQRECEGYDFQSETR